MLFKRLNILRYIFLPGQTPVVDMDPCPVTWPSFRHLIGSGQQISSTLWQNTHFNNYNLQLGVLDFLAVTPLYGVQK